MIDQNTKAIGPEKIRNLILKALEEKEPAFLLRMGDGEMIIARNDQQRIETFCNKQINRMIDEEELRAAQKWLTESVAASTLLGIPSEAHCRKGTLWKGLFDYYNEVRYSSKYEWLEKEYCTIDAHLELLGSGELFNIFESIDSIVLVTPRDIREKLQDRFSNIKKIEWHSLPAEQVYEVDKNTEINIFRRIEEISIALRQERREGQLMIFGAGPFGKILGTRFSQAGGVALDLGSVFDSFVGKKTRGKGKGATSSIDPVL